MTAPADHLLAVRDVALAFGGVVALADVSLHIRPCELVGLIGPNGSGKTSLCNVISGLYRPSAGSVRLNGEELVGRRPHEVARLGVARTFQGVETFGMSVMDNVLLGRHVHWRSGVAGVLARSRTERAERRAQFAAAAAALDALELTRHRAAPASDLPYGTRKRVELSRAVAMEPKLLILDEPTAGMNPTDKAEIATLIRRLNRDSGLAVLLVEHDLGFVRNLVSRLVVLNFGRVLAAGATDEVLDDESVVDAYVRG